MMEAIQLDLFDFAAMQAAVQSKEREVPETVVLRNFQNDPSLRQVPHALLTRSPLARESKLSLARSTCMC